MHGLRTIAWHLLISITSIIQHCLLINEKKSIHSIKFENHTQNPTTTVREYDFPYYFTAVSRCPCDWMSCRWNSSFFQMILDHISYIQLNSSNPKKSHSSTQYISIISLNNYWTLNANSFNQYHLLVVSFYFSICRFICSLIYPHYRQMYRAMNCTVCQWPVTRVQVVPHHRWPQDHYV